MTTVCHQVPFTLYSLEHMTTRTKFLYLSNEWKRIKTIHLDFLPCYCCTIHLSDRLLCLLINKGTFLILVYTMTMLILMDEFLNKSGHNSCTLSVNIQAHFNLFVVVSDESKSIASVVHVNQPTKLTEFCLKFGNARQHKSIYGQTKFSGNLDICIGEESTPVTNVYYFNFS